MNSTNKKILILFGSAIALMILIFSISIFLWVHTDLLSFLSIIHKLINYTQIVFSLVTFTALVFIYYSFDKTIKNDRFNQSIRTKSNTEEHELLVNSSKELSNTMINVVERFDEVNNKIEAFIPKINMLLFHSQLAQNHKSLLEKLEQALNSVYLHGTKKENFFFKKVMQKILVGIADFYTELREAKAEIIQIEKIFEISEIMKNILIENNFKEKEVLEIADLSKKILSEFNEIKNKEPKSSPKYKSNSDLIAIKFQFLVENIYEKYCKDLEIEKKSKEKVLTKDNKLKIVGDNNNSLQDVEAENINITINK